ncbi:hypothetical protein CHS0354_013244 [Potamilus streckersoni]|uniref:Uncharacterized protein n=1 Tax=Potamilus streckersoni TaxID=2493646 RepID=A0AAE0W6M3_9BIVA|nr:hypothetical protein CHS0354_013244 [Potamilus streckersoni]
MTRQRRNRLPKVWRLLEAKASISTSLKGITGTTLCNFEEDIVHEVSVICQLLRDVIKHKATFRTLMEEMCEVVHNSWHLRKYCGRRTERLVRLVPPGHRTRI